MKIIQFGSYDNKADAVQIENILKSHFDCEVAEWDGAGVEPSFWYLKIRVNERITSNDSAAYSLIARLLSSALLETQDSYEIKIDSLKRKIIETVSKF